MSAHIFIDAENVKPEIGLKAVKKFGNEYHIERVDIIGKEDAISSKYRDAGESYHVQNCYYGKNSADTWLCTEIAKTIFEKPEVEVIILVSSDRDFLAAVKLATDQNRKVILVSDGSGHKNLKALLYDLRINPDLIELVDFRSDLTLPPNPQSIKKKGTSEHMEIFKPPNGNLNKILELCAELPANMQAFFTKREQQVKFIFVKHNGTLTEIPFLDGINATTFANILIAMKIISKVNGLGKVVADSFLKVVDGQVYLRDEEEIVNPDADNSFNAVIDYFLENADLRTTIFIKNGAELQEVPFVNGIPLEIFSALLESYGVAADSTSIHSVIADSFLDLRGNKVFLRGEEKFSADLKIDFGKLSEQSLDFIKANEGKIRFISIAYAGIRHDVPFVDGMELHTFARLLHELNIIGKNAPTQKVLVNNGFTVRDNLVYKN